MKTSLFLLAPVILLTSCASQQGLAGTPVAPAANTAANQFGVPTAPGTYVPTAPPYQPVQPINPPAAPSAPTFSAPAPSIPTSTSDTLNGNVHTIQKGDSLWGIARKYSTTVDALKSSNGLAGDTIIEGRTIIIPGR